MQDCFGSVDINRFLGGFAVSGLGQNPAGLWRRGQHSVSESGLLALVFQSVSTRPMGRQHQVTACNHPVFHGNGDLPRIIAKQEMEIAGDDAISRRQYDKRACGDAKDKTDPGKCCEQCRGPDQPAGQGGQRQKRLRLSR